MKGISLLVPSVFANSQTQRLIVTATTLNISCHFFMLILYASVSRYNFPFLNFQFLGLKFKNITVSQPNKKLAAFKPPFSSISFTFLYYKITQDFLEVTLALGITLSFSTYLLTSYWIAVAWNRGSVADWGRQGVASTAAQRLKALPAVLASHMGTSFTQDHALVLIFLFSFFLM